MPVGQPADELSVLLQLPEPPEWDLERALADAELTLPVFTSCNPQLPLVRDEQRFLDLLSSNSNSKDSGSGPPGAHGPCNLGWPEPQGFTDCAEKYCTEEVHSAVKQRNRQAQRKCRQRKKEREQKVEEQVAGLSAALRRAEGHKQFLERSNLMLAAAAKEAVHGQEPQGVCVAAEGLHDWDPCALLQLREAWPYTVCLTPAHIVGLTLQELSRLWQDLAAAIVVQLPLAQRQVSQAAVAKVQALCREALALCGSLALGNPGIMYEFICRPYMPGNRAVYRAMVADLGATPQQCQRSRALVQDHAAAMRQLQESEQHLLASMQASETSMADQWPTGQGVQDLLQSICEDAIRLTFNFHSQIWSTCLSSLQLATCIVRSAPSCPDVACIAELLAERAP